MVINIATEDELSEAIAECLVHACFGENAVGLRLRRNGNGYLRTRLPSFCKMAKREPVFVLTDLDDMHCAPLLIQNWAGGQPLSPNLLLRVAVREVEAWLMADRVGFADFLGISMNLIPPDSEQISDPKRFLLKIAKRAKRDIRSELIVTKGAIASQGLGYNRTLTNFVKERWNLDHARQSSNSLHRAFKRLSQIAAA